MNKVALWAVVFFVIGLLVGGGGIYFGYKTSSSSTTSGLSGQIAIGGVCPLTGASSGQGLACKQAIEMGVNSVNSYLTANGITSYSFVAKVDDSASDPATTLSAVQSLASAGVKVFAGFQLSADLVNVISYAKSNNLVLTSGGSTTTSIDYPNRGPVFRLIPPNTFEGGGLAQVAHALGYSCFATIAINDAYGTDLTGTFINTTKTFSGTQILTSITYDPTTTDFSSQLAQLNTAVQSGVQTCGASKTAVQVTAFSEIESMITQAAASYPSLLSVAWFGAGSNNNQAIISAIGGPTVTKIHLYTPVYSITGGRYAAFAQQYQTTYGVPPLEYVPLDYDAVWILAMSMMQCQCTNGTTIATLFPQIANSYYGVSGWTHLDANGDRAGLTVGVAGGQIVNGKPNLVVDYYWDPVSNSVTPAVNGPALF